MPGFDVLNPTFPLPKRLFLEASAGTGKTFAIEHLFIRFLLNEIDLEMGHILIVTFTKAAVADLRKRLRKTLEKTIELLRTETRFPPYIEAKVQEGEEALFLALKKLGRALANFDELRLFTIHGFCFHTLQEIGLEGQIALDQGENESSRSLEESIKDFLRTEIHADLISPWQLECLLKSYRHDISALVCQLTKLVGQRIPIDRRPPFKESFALYKETLRQLIRDYHIAPQHLLEDLVNLASGFKEMCDRKKNLKGEIQSALEDFVIQIDDPREISSVLLKYEQENRLKRPVECFLHYPGFLEELQEKILPLVKDLVDPRMIEAILAEEIRVWVEKVIEKEEWVFFEDLIRIMEEKVKQPQCCQTIRKQYRVVFIDEFQDTDPKQWNIFSTLFLSSQFSGFFYVVGDPKQSIYRFRNADLYTYFQAQGLFSVNNRHSLDTNFRSTPSLVEALNSLLKPVKDLFPLPRYSSAFSYPPVKPGIREEYEWKDGKKSLHFCQCGTEAGFYPFIAAEIERLHALHTLPYSSFAILVKDRYQAERIQSFLKHRGLPATTKRSRHLTESMAFPILYDLLMAAHCPQDLNAIKRALGSPLFPESLKDIQDIPLDTLQLFHRLHQSLEEKGVLSFFRTLMEEEGKQERLLSQEGGDELYAELLQLIELLAQEGSTSETALFCFEKWKVESESERLKVRQHKKDAVQILTIHVSKGLEFDVVFPIGLLLSSQARRALFRDDEHHCLTLAEDKLLLHSQEVDAEKMRQFYVAVTRAKKRLYLPLLPPSPQSTSPQAGTASPMELFSIKRWKEEIFTSYLQQAEEVSFSLIENEYEPLARSKEEKISPLIAPPVLTLSFPPSSSHSYSSLSEVTPYIQKEKSVHEGLPAGAETGLVLHHLLETLSFEEAFRFKNPEQFAPFVTSFLAHTLLEGWEKQVCQMLYETLNTPLPHATPFPLAAVDPKKIWKEMEFLYPSQKPAGFLKGFVDLFFEFDGNYYFIDWKSNDLGNSKEDYTSVHLEKAMQQHDYFLQARIYQEALTRYIRLFSPTCHLGGGYYIFLRGLPEGIYTV